MIHMFFNNLGIHQNIIMITNSSNFSWKIESVRLVNIDGALPNPYEPYFVLIAIF
jgi:hypothetical protein